jgi:23S rRNA (adenine2503-C2)-methyltransferase
MISLIGKTREEFAEALREMQLSPAQLNRVLYWVYRRKISDFMEMDDLPKLLRSGFLKSFNTGFYPPKSRLVSKDGSVKYFFDTAGNGVVETVYLPDGDRHTLCVSTQAGCRMSCVFCQTGAGGFHGNLSSAEILNQVCSIPEALMLTHLVFMGMGEPFDNLKEVLKSLQILIAEWGLAFGAGNITVSTVGILPGIKVFLNDTKSQLALSLHSPFPEERKQWIPAENKYPVQETINYLSSVPLGKKRRISVEYTMIDGINDSIKHQEGLFQLLNNTGIRVNLIPFNPVPGLEWCASSVQRIQEFKDFLNSKRIPTTIRVSRGLDIGAACGLLGKTP